MIQKILISAFVAHSLLLTPANAKPKIVPLFSADACDEKLKNTKYNQDYFIMFTSDDIRAVWIYKPDVVKAAMSICPGARIRVRPHPEAGRVYQLVPLGTPKSKDDLPLSPPTNEKTENLDEIHLAACNAVGEHLRAAGIARYEMTTTFATKEVDRESRDKFIAAMKMADESLNEICTGTSPARHRWE